MRSVFGALFSFKAIRAQALNKATVSASQELPVPKDSHDDTTTHAQVGTGHGAEDTWGVQATDSWGIESSGNSWATSATEDWGSGAGSVVAEPNSATTDDWGSGGGSVVAEPSSATTGGWGSGRGSGVADPFTATTGGCGSGGGSTVVEPSSTTMNMPEVEPAGVGNQLARGAEQGSSSGATTGTARDATSCHDVHVGAAAGALGDMQLEDTSRGSTRNKPLAAADNLGTGKAVDAAPDSCSAGSHKEGDSSLSHTFTPFYLNVIEVRH